MSLLASRLCDAPPRFRALACSQDMIGWRRMMEGMISKEMIDDNYSAPIRLP